MIVQALAFYLFAAVLIVSALMVISAKNPVHSVLFLILSFVNAAGLFVLLGAEFVAMILVIVYVGAVAVLFLFVVMMLDIDFANLRKGAMQYVPFGVIIGSILMIELIMAYAARPPDAVMAQNLAMPTDAFAHLTNTEALGNILYTYHFAAFQLAGLVLFVAMIGAIVLTHRQRPGIRKQKVADQQARKPQDAMEIVNVSTGSGA